MAYIRRRGCTCPNKAKCSCGAKYSFTIDAGRDPVTGKRKQITRSGYNTKKEAQAAAALVETELTQGTHVRETELLFPDLAQDWLKNYKVTHSVKSSTIRVRQHEISRLTDYFKFAKVKDITKKAYQIALNDLKEKGYAHNTLSGIHATGRMIFAYAMKFDMIKTDPTEYAILPRENKTLEELENEVEVPKYLEKEELSRFLRTAREQGLDSDYTIFLTLAYSGMRVGELCALKWRDIDFDQHSISINRTYYNPNSKADHYELLAPKTKKSKRMIEVEPVVIEELERHRSVQRLHKMAVRNRYHDEDFVFAKVTEYPGYPWTIQTIEGRMTRLLKRAGLQTDLTPHSLRHTHTSLLAEAGARLEEIMDRLGHSDDKTTKTVYLHVTKTRKREASKMFGELMKNT